MINDTINKGMINLHNITIGASNTITSVPEHTYKFFFLYFFIPLLTGLIIIVFVKFKSEIQLWIKRKFANFGYVEIMMLNTNKRLKSKMIDLDEFNTFKFNSKRYSLEKMQDFVFGYRDNIPVFLYDTNFIMPLTINKVKINKEIEKRYKEMGIELTQPEISAIGIKLEPTILELVYSKKLISDLYSIMRDDNWQKILIWALLGIGIIAVLYYTGALDQILGAFGIHLHPVVNAVNQTATTNTTQVGAIVK